MAPRGRPPKLGERRAREGGTPGQGKTSHRPITDLVAVAGRNVPISPPDDIPPEAAELWTEIVRVLAEAGIIDAIDLPMLRQLTLQYARARQAATVLDEPLTEKELEDLAGDLHRSETIERALQTKVAALLQQGISPPTGDINALANYSTSVANKRAYIAALQRSGRVVALGSTGQLVEHPMVATERAAASLLLRFASEYAMTPVARARLGIAVLEGRSIAKELEEDIGARRRAKTPAGGSTKKRPGSGRKKRTGALDEDDA